MIQEPTDAAFERWCSSRHRDVTEDSAWRLSCYRMALYAFAQARLDAQALWKNAPNGAVSSQLLRSAGSIAANIAEGYSHPAIPDRQRYFVLALGSLRECVTWYEGARGVLPEPTTDERITRLGHVRRMLLKLVAPDQGGRLPDRWG